MVVPPGVDKLLDLYLFPWANSFPPPGRSLNGTDAGLDCFFLAILWRRVRLKRMKQVGGDGGDLVNGSQKGGFVDL